MTTAGVNITKVNIVDTMKTVRNTFNQNIYWYAGNAPFADTSIATGDTTGYALGNLEESIADANVTAATIVDQFRVYANSLSRIRSVRFVTTYGGGVTRDETQIVNLKESYALNPVSWNELVPNAPAVGVTISASELDTFVNALSTVISNHRNNTVTIQEDYCHSSCHGSCHGSL
jgi:hypothetical protein